MADLLIITHEHIGHKMAGPGIRAWELAKALTYSGFDILLATPYAGFSGEGALTVVNFSWDEPSSLEHWIARSRAVMASGPVLSRVVHWLQKPLNLPTIVDLYDVREIETVLLSVFLESSFPFLTDLLIEETLVYLRQGDFFLYATDRQLDFWLGALWMTGRLNDSTLTIDPMQWIVCVPMGIPDDPPCWEKPVLKGVIPGIGPQDIVILWMGGIWEWTDPITLGQAIEQILLYRQDVRVVFGALHHYDIQVVPHMSKAKQFLQWCQERDWLGRYIFFLDWVPYEKRGSYLLEADIGISLHDHPLESRYAIRSRTLDYLWASLPSVLSAGDELADLLGTYGLARLVPPQNPRAVAEAVLDLLKDPPPRERLAQQTLLLRKRLQWSTVVQPIIPFLRCPSMAPDSFRARSRIPYWIGLRAENDRLRAENDRLRAENDRLRVENDRLEAIRKGQIVRILNRLYRIWGRTFL